MATPTVEEVRDSRLDVIVHPEDDDEWIIKHRDDIITCDKSGAELLAREILSKLPNPEPLFRVASVVRLTMDDPVNGDEKGDIRVVAGACEDGISHTVFSEEMGDFVDVTCEVLERFEADTPMTKQNIREWGVTKSNWSEEEYGI